MGFTFGVEHRYVERCSDYDDAALTALEKDGQVVVLLGESTWVPVVRIAHPYEEEGAA